MENTQKAIIVIALLAVYVSGYNESIVDTKQNVTIDGLPTQFFDVLVGGLEKNLYLTQSSGSYILLIIVVFALILLMKGFWRWVRK